MQENLSPRWFRSANAFPSLIVRANGIAAEGAFAKAQAEFLHPDAAEVATLDALLAKTNLGVVAHYYMDPELQGVLSRCKHQHIHISDSLLMADKAVEMAQNGARGIVVLGVDFMSENARAMLDRAGFSELPLFRVSERAIGCSLAEAAETDAYSAYLQQAKKHARALHVIYINTSLVTKARAHHIVPTITCTSSNVVQTVLSGFAQIEGVHVFFGPDTYMGENLERLFRSMLTMSDAEIQAVHPAHTRATLTSALERFHYFKQGNCIVHHMFGARVVERVRAEHQDAMITAHLEVPGEMFELALEAQNQGCGRVGSTADILKFITQKVQQEKAKAVPSRVSFVLGTEAGMITSIVRAVEKAIAGTSVECEILFPVAAEAVFATGDAEMPVVPGTSGGEGCTTAGGCATCPYMKMNSLDALIEVCERFADSAQKTHMQKLHPRKYLELIDGRTVADLGSESIVHMRDFSREGKLSDALVAQVHTSSR